MAMPEPKMAASNSHRPRAEPIRMGAVLISGR
jgi:hypothetical protein